ncbi:ABC-2 type transport system permease protein [Anaerosporobacter mobilis DSM 15930]|jgi:ABC-2 type transport system permease protein|uniref:Transport permease protein n=1 Tax=Anaerosporobacter mobilis DSM 15930 TaxID=1120996 RepID=A0A1M7N4Q9_9FIRM|nr:ABC transporter permease [Anaerosporobacter mobilis]SHM98470.1 ABC-2 type transport system permease protein [Anaerosporobacter mobilis DSM 15930]
MKAYKAMLKTEFQLSLRGIDMFIFAICMPIVVTILLGSMFRNKPAFEGASYTFFEQSFGAISTIAICAGGVMGLPLVISDYRNRKILKRLQVTPSSPTLILAVQVSIYTIYSIASLLLVYATAKIFFHYEMAGSLLYFTGSYLLVMLSMFSIGMMVGGIARDIKSASVIASLLYFPMLLFSGATLPYEVMPSSLQKVADLLPLTQGIKLIKASALGLPINDVVLPIILMILLSIICIGISIRFFKWE